MDEIKDLTRSKGPDNDENFNSYDIYNPIEFIPFDKCRYENFKMRKKFSTSGHRINSIDISPLGDYMVSSINKEKVVAYNILVGCESRDIQSKKYGCNQVIFAGESSKILYTSSKGSDDIRYLSLEDKKYVRFFKGHKDEVLSLSMSPNKTNFLSSSKDGMIRLWDLRSDECCETSNYINKNPIVTYDPKGLIFAVSEERNIVKLFDSRNTTQPPFRFFSFQSYSGKVNNIKFSPDGRKLIVSGDGTNFYTIDTFSGKRVAFEGIKNPKKRRFGVDYSPCGKYIIAGSDCGELIYYNAKTGNIIKKFSSTHDSFVGNVAFNRKYLMLVSGGRNLIWWTPDYDDEVFGGLD
uniref:WD_REPEATS_REGION domain-containing protein n=1 Tax=Strongyloides venezuelensis TaxID=75913 RepID=A0A0K0F3D1_STRVS